MDPTYSSIRAVLPFRTPSIRSSDLNRPADFTYFLSRILGIVPRYRYHRALSLGSWTHALLEHGGSPSSAYASLLDSHLAKCREACALSGISDPTPFLENEAKDGMHAAVWLDALSRIPMQITPQLRAAFPDYLSEKNGWYLLGREIPASVPFGTTALRATFDALYYHAPTNRLWVLDFKTTDLDPAVRLSTCPIESQTHLYTHILNALLPESQLLLNEIAKVASVLERPKVGGMIHLVLQKPTIRFSGKDRDRLEVSGGKTKPIGSPVLSNYAQRCMDWYLGDNEYTHLKAQREASPPLGLSFTHFTGTPSWFKEQLNRRERLICLSGSGPDAAPDKSVWDLCPPSVDGMMDWSEPSVYAPFYLNPPSMFPSIIQQNNLIIADRDGDFPSNLAVPFLRLSKKEPAHASSPA